MFLMDRVKRDVYIILVFQGLVSHSISSVSKTQIDKQHVSVGGVLNLEVTT